MNRLIDGASGLGDFLVQGWTIFLTVPDRL
jgi:hypothetical protein